MSIAHGHLRQLGEGGGFKCGRTRCLEAEIVIWVVRRSPERRASTSLWLPRSHCLANDQRFPCLLSSVSQKLRCVTFQTV